MPVLVFRISRILEALGDPSATPNDILRYLEALKAETSIIDDERVEVEIEVDRPDLYLPEGVARAVKGLIGKEKGIPRYVVTDSGVAIDAGPVETRPFIAGAVVWDVNVDEYFLEDLIQFQEKLHLSIGFRRERFAIGFHDLDKLPGSRIVYEYVDIRAAKFRPLGYSYEMTVKEILEKTEQGVKYGNLSVKADKHPALVSNGEIISLPPVINSELTKIEPGTKNIFIDVTGTDREAVEKAVTLIAFTLAERSKTRRVGLVSTTYPSGLTSTTPRRRGVVVELDVNRVNHWLGVELSSSDVVEYALMSRFNAVIRSNNVVEIETPPYRLDIFGWVDVAEDLLLAMGFAKLELKRPRLMLRGKFLDYTVWERKARELLLGLGFTEVYTFTMANCREQEEIGGIASSRLVRIKNPSHAEYDCMRATLIPVLLRITSFNKSRKDLKVFEAGVTVEVAPGTDTGSVTKRKLGIAILGEKAGYEDIQAYVYALIRGLGDEISTVERTVHPSMIKGRTALVRTLQGLEIVMGEVNPSVLEKYEIDYPVAIAEIDYTRVRPPKPRE